jgi:hypothetical protein
MVDLVRRSLEAFLPALAEAEADAMEQRLQRLRALADRVPTISNAPSVRRHGPRRPTGIPWKRAW